MESLLVDKLKEAEASLVDLIDGSSKRSSEKVERVAYEALNQVRRALQLASPPGTQAVRQGYTAEVGTGLGKGDSMVEHHESFGSISISKPSGGRLRLVGAMAQSLPSCIEIRVHRSRRDIDTRFHTEHYYHEGTPLLVLRLSTYQWAELICSMQGSPSPCTIAAVAGVQMDPVPDEMKTPLEQITHDARKAMFEVPEVEAQFLAALEDVAAKLPDLKLGKKKEDDLRRAILGLRNHVDAPKAAATWATQRITEDTELTVSQAKVEMAAAFQSLVQRTGLAAIEGQLADAIKLQIAEGRE